MTIPQYEVFAIRSATVDRLRSQNRMTLDCFIWASLSSRCMPSSVSAMQCPSGNGIRQYGDPQHEIVAAALHRAPLPAAL